MAPNSVIPFESPATLLIRYTVPPGATEPLFSLFSIGYPRYFTDPPRIKNGLMLQAKLTNFTKIMREMMGSNPKILYDSERVRYIMHSCKKKEKRVEVFTFLHTLLPALGRLSHSVKECQKYTIEAESHLQGGTVLEADSEVIPLPRTGDVQDS